MDRKHHRHPASSFQYLLEHARYFARSVHVCRAMDCKNEVVTRHEPKLLPKHGASKTVQICKQSINHCVTDKENAVLGYARCPEIAVCCFTRREKPIGDRVGHHAIDLLWHRPISRSYAA